MRMHRCDVIEAYVVLILLARANEPLYTENIREELEKNFIGNSKLPNTRTLAAIFRRSDYFINTKELDGYPIRYKISPEIYESLLPYIPKLFQLASSPKKLLKKIKEHLP